MVRATWTDREAAGILLREARRAARFVGYVAASASLAGAFLVGVLMGQAAFTRRSIPRAEAPPPRGDGRYGTNYGGAPLRLVMLGDSLAAGYGVAKPRQTPGALLAAGLAARLRRPVHLRNLAVVGSTSAMLGPQVEAAVEWRPDVAVIIVGANDVTHRADQAAAVRHLASAVRVLRATGAQVLVGTCPDLGSIRSIPPPLRWLARRWSRQLAAAQTVAVVEAGGTTVSLGDLLGPLFAAAPHRMLGHDRYHPSVEGYARAAAAILPTVVALLLGEGAAPSRLAVDQGVQSLPQAAEQAAHTAGTEVTGARVAGRERGPAGRWVWLRRRVRDAIKPSDPAPDAAAVPSSQERPGSARPLSVGETL
jgi:lysophospholipase L1-like esterase